MGDIGRRNLVERAETKESSTGKLFIGRQQTRRIRLRKDRKEYKGRRSKRREKIFIDRKEKFRS